MEESRQLSLVRFDALDEEGRLLVLADRDRPEHARHVMLSQVKAHLIVDKGNQT